MNKRILKRLVCILLVLCLMFGSAYSVYYVTERSALYADLKYLCQFPDYKDSLSQFNIINYYKKLPQSFDPNKINVASMDGYLRTARFFIEWAYGGFQPQPSCNAVVRAKYIGKTSNPEAKLRGEFKFKVTGVVIGDDFATIEIGDTVQLFSERYNLNRYSIAEYMLNYYDVKYEIGEEYLLFLIADSQVVNYKNDEVPYYYYYRPTNRIYLNKLSGEYPSMKMFPGPVEYDATYFGAETKYVSADEFVDLFYKAASEYELEWIE